MEAEKRRTLLAIMGRGIQRWQVKSPVSDVYSWHLTEDLETCDDNFAHLPVAVAPNDDDPHCILGGGRLNLKAGLEFIVGQAPEIVVCAYGARSAYLESIQGPSESEVMGLELTCRLGGHSPKPLIVTWDRNKPTPEGSRSNTQREIANIFALAIEREIRNVIILSLSVHLPRCKVFGDDWQKRRPKFAGLNVEYVASDVFLVRVNPEIFNQRVSVMHGSQAYARTRALEEKGVSDFLSGRYQ